jgi:ABC-type multidrug transport system fused ATPase/permease subunit
LVVLFLFAVTFTIQYFLFKKATKLNIAKKRRYAEENRHIFERINNLEYIKVTSGENYEQTKLNRLLDRNFQKNKKSLL